jgi:SDR family mycofactocin-dependent oxidoreductase
MTGAVGRLEGKVAFITGAARGQGRSHAVRLAAEGADIIAVDCPEKIPTIPYSLATQEELATTVAEVERLGRRIVAEEADVRDLAVLTRVVDRGVAQLGRLDIVLANAGVTSYAPALDLTEEQWQDMVDVNLTGVWKTLKASVPHIISGNRGGAVVLTSSMAALKAYEHTAHYSATKGALVSMMRVLAKELAPHNIRVNTVHPNTVGTGMVHNEATYRIFRPELPNPGRREFEAAARHLNRLPVATLDSEDITNAVLYLVSDDGRYVTGITHVVDAGGGL